MAPAPAPAVDKSEVSDSLDFKPPPGVILPPPEIRKALEKVAGYVIRNGAAFEARIVEQAGSKPQFQFILPDNPYNSYYLWRLSEIREGRGSDIAAGREGEAPLPKKKQGPQAPPEFHFSARMPNMSAVDLETVKLTALFIAKNGRPWMTALSQREMTNPNFAFLRPQHSWHSFFTRLVDQYTELITGDSVDNGNPQKAMIAQLEKNIDNRYHLLERARKRAEWVKYQETQKVRKEEEEEAEKISFAQIDWQDFTIVEKIEFTESDDQTQLPPPTSLNDLQSASLEQKAHNSLVNSNHRIEEAMPGDEDYLQYQQPAYAPTPVQQTPLAMGMPPPPTSYMPSPQPSISPAGAAPFAPPLSRPHEDEESSRFAERQAQQQRAEAARAAASGQGPMRIRQDYVPRAQARRQNVATGICPNCGQSIPMSEMDQHMRSKFSFPASQSGS